MLFTKFTKSVKAITGGVVTRGTPFCKSSPLLEVSPVADEAEGEILPLGTIFADHSRLSLLAAVCITVNMKKKRW